MLVDEVLLSWWHKYDIGARYSYIKVIHKGEGSVRLDQPNGVVSASVLR